MKAKRLFIVLAAMLLSIGNISAQSLGDVNKDGKVDEKDVAALATYILSAGSGNNQANVNSDQKVDVADITALINLIKTANTQYFWFGTIKPTATNYTSKQGIVTTIKSLDEALEQHISVTEKQYGVILCPSSWNVNADDIVVQDNTNGTIYLMKKVSTDIPNHDVFQTIAKIRTSTTIYLRKKTVAKTKFPNAVAAHAIGLREDGRRQIVGHFLAVHRLHAIVT